MEEDFEIPAWKYALVKDHFQGDVKAKHANANIHSNCYGDQVDITVTEKITNFSSRVAAEEVSDNQNDSERKESATGLSCPSMEDSVIAPFSVKKLHCLCHRNLTSGSGSCSKSCCNSRRLQKHVESSELDQSVVSSKPRLVRDTRSFPVSLESVTPASSRDQGSNCVTVIIKTRPTDSLVQRQRTVQTKMKKVEVLKSKYRLKYDCDHHSDERAFYNFCFVSPAEARKFLKDVSAFAASSVGPSTRSIIHFLSTEKMLGYQYAPVLTEKELLTLHSPQSCGNVFKTAIKVHITEDHIEKEDVKFLFKGVIEINEFIFDSKSKEAKTLGELRAKAKSYKLIRDEFGKYNLLSKDLISKIEALSLIYNFEVKSIQLGIRTLSFSTKVDLFSFLLSEEGKHLKSLQIDPHLILTSNSNSGENIKSVDDVCKGDEPNKNFRFHYELEDSEKLHADALELDGDSVLNDSCATEASVYEAVIAQKDDEIRNLKQQLLFTNSQLDRKKVESKKNESKFFEVQDCLDQIRELSIKSTNHVLSSVRDKLKDRR